ncbi:tetratricopeptide repeat protein [Thalassotalea crassostreae]|uniref:tetratricopeptide repeat protein n=1 Tax=Thalassotalea crassostreae TaxID=1763536 RepID=UPI0008385366|nr:hypothetical protein [Thalassotalea crassostreae]
MTVFRELKRRNVFKVATAYLITAWLILQVASVIEPHIGLPSWFIPFIITILALGLPIACLLAWAFELTPEGIKATKLVTKEESITATTGKKMNNHIIIAMGLAMIFLIYKAYFTSEETVEVTSSQEEVIDVSKPKSDAIDADIVSIAVLPFVNMSNDPEQEYFSDGLSEELLNVLARIKQLKVAARTSSFFFKNKNMDIKEIADKLDVEHVLEGSVRRSGNKLRVTAQLIKADNGYHIWSETYDYEFDDIFKIQDEISAAVVQQLKVTLLNEELVSLTEHGTSNPEAQDAYLKGRYFMRSRTPKSLAKAVKSFKYSISLDGNNQHAISGLVDSYSLQATYANLTVQDFIALAKPILKPFMESNSNSAEMDTSIGAYYKSINNIAKSKEFFERAIEKNKNYVQAYHWLGHLYRLEGQDIEKAKTNFLKGLKLDPYSEILLLSLFGANYQSGNLLEAENYLSLVNEIAPSGSYGNAVTLEYYWVTGRDWERAIRLIESRAMVKSQLNYNEQFAFYLALDDLEQAEKQLAAIDSAVAYQASIVFNYQALYLTKLDKGLITEQQYRSKLKEKIVLYPHHDNIGLEVDIFLRQQNYQAAFDLMTSKYQRLIGQESIHMEDLVAAAYYLYLIGKLEKPLDEALNRAVLNKLSAFDKVNTNPEFASYYKAILYTLIGNNKKALEHLNKLYVEGDFYKYVVLTKRWVLFEDLRKTSEMQNIISTAMNKLDKKRAEFNAVRSNAVTNTQDPQVEQEGRGGNL